MNTVTLSAQKASKPNLLNNESNAEAITTKSQSNFALSFCFLPKIKRDAIISFYAFSRVVDDAVDDNSKDEATKLLDFWREEIAHCYQGSPTHPITQALQESIRKFDLTREYFDLLIEGCEWDLDKTRYNTYQELYQYCYRVAGCIGLVCMQIFGLKDTIAKQAAEELGVALQLTNILRDVAEDARRGRLYLPLEDLKRYGLDERNIMGSSRDFKPNAKQKLLFKLMAERAEVLYNRAFTKMKQLPRRPLIAAWIMGKIYFRLLKKIRGKDYNIYGNKIKISKMSKLTIALWQWGLSLRDRKSTY